MQLGWPLIPGGQLETSGNGYLCSLAQTVVATMCTEAVAAKLVMRDTSPKYFPWPNSFNTV